MDLSTPAKADRINLRISPESKEIIEKAAAARGLSVSSYITSVVVPAAQADLLMSQQITLSDRDRDLFLSALSAEPKPNEALQSAAARFRAKYDNP